MVYAECAWCGKWKEAYAWQECVDQDNKGNELHAAMCKECYHAIWGDPEAEGDASGGDVERLLKEGLDKGVLRLVKDEEAEVKYLPPSQRSLKERREYWERVRGQYRDCLGEHGKDGNNCGGCTRETQDDCIEYAEFVKKEAEEG